MPLFFCLPPLHRSFHFHIHPMPFPTNTLSIAKLAKMKKPKNPFRSTLRRRIRKMLSKADRNIQSRLKPTTRDQCRGILVFALVVVLISCLIVLFVQNLIYFLRILFSELSGLCVFLAPSVHDHISRFSPDDFVFLIPVRSFSIIIVLICFFFFEG